MLDGKDSPFNTSIRPETPDETRQAVKSLKNQGVDFIKVHLLLTKDVFKAVAEASQEENMIFGGHVPDSVTPQLAVEKGMGYIEHMSRLEEADDALIQKIADTKVWQCPTLKLSPAQQRFQMTNVLSQAGVSMVAGTDSPAGQNLCPGVSLLDELELMNQAGLTPLATLQTATKNAADSVGMLSEMGTLEAGKFADLVILDQNPLEDIRNIRSISAVVADGQLYSGKKLASMQALANKLDQCNPQGRLAARDLVSAGHSCCSV